MCAMFARKQRTVKTAVNVAIDGHNLKAVQVVSPSPELCLTLFGRTNSVRLGSFPLQS